MQSLLTLKKHVFIDIFRDLPFIFFVKYQQDSKFDNPSYKVLLLF